MQQKNILITGTSSGFGAAMVETLAKQGHRIYAGMRNTGGKNLQAKQQLESLARDKNWDVRVIDLDVNVQESVDLAVKQIIENDQYIDVLINNAGALYMGLTEAFSLEQVQEQKDVNFIAPMRMYRAVLPFMHKQNDGLVINISSVSGRLVFPFMGIYCASKYALEAAAESMRYELAPSAIDSILVEPGPFNTGILGKTQRETDTERFSAYGDRANTTTSMQSGFDEYMANNPDADPQIVADTVLRLIDTPFGQRPIRTVVGADFGARELNELNIPIQQATLEAVGFADLDQSKAIEVDVA